MSDIVKELEQFIQTLEQAHPPRTNAKVDYVGIYQRILKLNRPVTVSEISKQTGVKYNYLYSWFRRKTIPVKEAAAKLKSGNIKADEIAFVRAGGVFVPIQVLAAKLQK